MSYHKFFLVLAMSWWFYFLSIAYGGLGLFPGNLLPGNDPSKPSVTVVYVYSGNDEQYPANLAYFLRNGVRENDGNKYYLVLQQHDWKETVSSSCICSRGCPGSSGRMEKLL